MRITFVLSFLELTGGHRAVIEIGNRLVEAGHEVKLVYPARSILSRRNDVLRRLGGLAPPVFRQNGDNLDWAEFNGEIVRVRDLEDARMPDADVVIATAWQTAERVATFRPSRGAKVYFIQHYETWSGPESRVDATWRAPFTRVASSEWLARLGRERFGIEDIHVVPYGVDLDVFYPEPAAAQSGPLRVGVMHHLEEWKGVADAATAVARMRAEGRAVQFAAFGAFSQRGALPADAELHVQPARDELRRFYSSLDVFLCASWSETGPMTIPEALACEACVVSTDVGNVSLWTDSGEGAFVVPPRDPEALATALARALDDPTERLRRARRGRELIQPFTWERAASAFERSLESAL